MPTTVPTPADPHDWDRIEAGHLAVDALNNIGELRGLLEHDPDALPALHSALGVLLGQDVPSIGVPVVVTDSAATGDRGITVTAEVRATLGHSFGMVSINEDWQSDPELNSWIPLDPDDADALADALNAAAGAARVALLTEGGQR